MLNKPFASFALLFALSSSAAPALAQDAAPVPLTAAEHQARAKTYREHAAAYRKEADEHRKMAKAYAASHPDFKGGTKNPFNAKMEKHCAALVKDYETLATDSEQAAKFHELRASETK